MSRIFKATTIALIVLAPSPAVSQNSFCQGDQCYYMDSNGNKIRDMTKEEITDLKRQNARRALESIECDWSADPKGCKQFIRQIFRMFPM